VTIRVAAEMAKDLTKSIFDKFIRRKTQFRLKLMVDSEKSLLARKLEKERLERKIQLHALRKEVVNEIKNVELIRMKQKFNDKFTKNFIKSIIDAENFKRSQELYRKNQIS
jgi:CO/xanthine dehydrogenase FAD-binding subunit